MVIYDDLDLPNAQVKLKLRGGHGGHNGMRSIIEHFRGNSDFPRLRIGIGRPTNGRIPIVKHVLQVCTSVYNKPPRLNSLTSSRQNK